MKLPVLNSLTFLAVFILVSVASFAYAESFKDTVTDMEFVSVKGGRYIMGDISRKESDSSPPHRVTVSDFLISKFEVTFQQYDKFCEETGRKKPADEGWGRGSRPVINVSWKDAVAFTEWLSQKSGRKFRLPSESQWEYAARAGKTNPYWWGTQKEKNMANCFDCDSEWDNLSTAPVGSFKPNPWGLYDMNGNVSEWVFDKAHEGYEKAPETEDPWLENGLDMRIVRGGGYSSNIENIKVYFRDWYPETFSNRNLGFRIVILD